MWCSDCQQDVPAVASKAHESLVCPRCQGELAGVTAPKDDGIALDSFDCTVAEDLSAPVDWLDQAESRQKLNEIGRKLRVGSQQQSVAGSSPIWNNAWSEATPPPLVQPQVQLHSVARRSASEPRGRQKVSWLVSFFLSGGILGFGVGLSLLAWSAAFQLPLLWQSGMTLTIGAEGVLILSLTWMAAQLWHNGRKVNRQLKGVDQQLGEMKDFAGSLAGGQLSSSQHYYHHFSQAASPRMLVSNLRGQVDQLAARVAAEG